MAESIIELIMNLKKKCAENDAGIFNELGLSPGEYNFFLAAKDCENTDCRHISKKMGISPSRFSRTVDKLVNNGYLTRKSDEKDRRAIKIDFTKKGRALIEKIDRKIMECDKKLSANISKKQIQAIRDNLAELLRNFD